MLSASQTKSELLMPILCRRETHCEFCDTLLPDWRSCMTPASGSCAPAIMNVSFGGTAYSFEVQPGANGYNEFADRVRAAFSLPEDSDLNITFTCDEPCQPGIAPSLCSSRFLCMPNGALLLTMDCRHFWKCSLISGHLI